MFSRNLESFGNCGEEGRGHWETVKAERNRCMPGRGETPQISAQWRLCASTTWLYNLISYWRGRVGVVSDCCCCTNHRMARFIQPASVLPLQSREAPPLPTFDS